RRPHSELALLHHHHFGATFRTVTERCYGGRRLRLRQRHHQSDRKRAHCVLSQNLLHLELLYVTKRLVLLVTANAGLNAAAHGKIWREEPVFAGKVICGVRSETSGQSWPSKVRYNPCRRVDTPIAAGHTRYGTDEMDFDPVCVDDCRTVVHG